MSTTTYTSPVDKLLSLGKPESNLPEKWPNYLELGLGPEHIPELIHMATDLELRGPESQEKSEEEDPDFWAPLHAIRALGQLQAGIAAEPLVNLLAGLKDDEWMLEELPAVFGMIGPVAIPALTAYLADSSNDIYLRAYASNGLLEIADRYPQHREESIATISRQLEAYEENEHEFNAFIIGDLVRLKAVETLPLIERAFKADRVDEFVVDLNYVLEEFGLKEREVVESPFLEMFKEISASRANQQETPSPSSEKPSIPPPSRTNSEKVIKFSGKKITKKKSKKKR